jgi:hypothetical protein
LISLGFGLSVLSCKNPVGIPEGIPDAEIPPILGIDSVVVGQPVFFCSRWVEGFDPPSGRMIVDLYFGRAGPEVPPDRPLHEQITAVEHHGGRILHRFQFPAVRADIPASRIPELYQSGSLNLARAVPYSDRFDWPVMVGYIDPPGDAELARFADLGGRLTHVFETFPAIAGDLPDAAFPALRADGGVGYVEADGSLCPTS